jgi:hypothetical protein
MANGGQIIRVGKWMNVGVVALFLAAGSTGYLAYAEMLQLLAAKRQDETHAGDTDSAVVADQNSSASGGGRKKQTAARLVHYWVAQLLEMAIISAVVIWFSAIAVIADIRRTWFSIALRIVVGVLLVTLVLHTNFTGYLGPSGSSQLRADTLIRFKVIHQFFEPGLLIALIVWWWFLSNRLDRASRPKSVIECT